MPQSLSLPHPDLQHATALKPPTPHVTSLPGRAAIRALDLLWAYCRSNDWAGYDPYDALNSRIFTTVPVLNSRIPRLALTQALKRSPINIRSLFLIPKTHNAKAIALFLAAAVKSAGAPFSDRDARTLIDLLVTLRSPGTAYWCWGYSFPWQTRTVLVPRQAPNLVCTTFVANALLDAYEQHGESRLLEMAVSSAQYLLDELYWSDGTGAGFTYPLREFRSNIHNAHFLGAALLCRVSRLTGDSRLLAPALEVARHSAAQQKDDGSWPYGAGPAHQWIDNFHTGYNLCALHDIATDVRTTEFSAHLRHGFDFYLDHFFRDDGAPKYFHDRTYPIDIHCVAQSLITLVALQHLDARALPLARRVLDWALEHMWDPRGFFYYRVLRSAVIRTSYMRWSQAWMVLALSTVLNDATSREACEHTSGVLS